MNRLRLPRFRVIHVPVFYILVPHAATGWCQNSGSPSTTGEVLTLDRAVTLRCPHAGGVLHRSLCRQVG
jgi:hypothetical protein